MAEAWRQASIITTEETCMTDTALVELRQVTQDLRRRDFTPTRDLALSLVSAAQHALETSYSVEDLKQVADELATVETWYRRRQAQLIDGNLLVAQRFRTERALGTMLPRLPDGPRKVCSSMEQLDRDENGITRKDAFRWRRMAEIDEADFEHWIDENVNSNELTTAALLRLWPMARAPEEDVTETPSEMSYEVVGQVEVITPYGPCLVFEGPDVPLGRYEATLSPVGGKHV
jgi:hypothetical protein